jgi:predicted phosphodiesterase
VKWIRGNAERELKEAGLAPQEVTEWLRSRLAPETIDWLCGLPLTLVHDAVLYCHATPRNDEDIFTERTPEERLVDIFAPVEQDVVVCGHTHMQFDRTIAGKRVVNAGSVGMAYDEPPGAYWRLDLEPRFTPYELDTGDWPFEWPSSTREEAVSFFTSRGL